MHGVGIIRWIEDVTHRQLLVEEGALYPALHRLEERALLSAEWGLTESGRRAKYYALTARGRRELAAETTRWNRYATAMQRILMAQEVR
jgi:DNA-binding PadR family transcriptional regulator